MSTEIIAVVSFIRGYHDHMDIWLPNVGEEYSLKREPNNKEDSNAFAVVRKKQPNVRPTRRESLREKPVLKPHQHPNGMMRDLEIIGHVPKLMALWLTKFLKRASNSGKAVIKGKRVNRGGGYGLEIPCEYEFTGDSFSINCLKTKLIMEGFEIK